MTTLSTPYSERKEWSDVTPVPQDDGPDPVCPIAYSSEYADAMSYFRAVSAKREYSTRALELTGTIIDMNPGHYTVWLYRKDIVFALDLDFQQELDFVESVANETPKCYQLWHHRQVIIEKLGDASQELAFIERVLNGDPKNFHAWSYRQWVIKTFNLWDGELAFVDQLLDSDIRNNSAWNQRYFALHYRPTPADNETLQREVDYAIKKIRLAPHNESAWNYLAGTIRRKPERLLAGVDDIVAEMATEAPVSVPLLAFIVESFQEHAELGNHQQRREKALWACDELAERQDRIRERYWKHCRNSIA